MLALVLAILAAMHIIGAMWSDAIEQIKSATGWSDQRIADELRSQSSGTVDPDQSTISRLRRGLHTPSFPLGDQLSKLRDRVREGKAA